MQDLRDAFRALRSTPVVTAAAVLSLTLGIGANTAIFSLLNAILFRPLPVSEPERLVMISSGERSQTSWPQAVWHQVRDRQLVEDGFAWYWNRFDTASGGERAFVDGLMVSGRTFESLGLRPALGRLLTMADEQSSRGPVAGQSRSSATSTGSGDLTVRLTCSADLSCSIGAPSRLLA